MDLGHISGVTGVRHSPDGLSLTYASELLIEADSRVAAQRALNLITAAKLLVEGGDTSFFGSGMQPIIPDDPRHNEDLDPLEIETALRHHEATFDLGTAAAVAAKATHWRKWTISLVKHALSCRHFAIHSMDLDPSQGYRFSVAKDPYDYLAMSHAIFIAFSAIEDLGIKAENRAKDHSGKWLPQQLASIEKRLLSNNVEPHGTVIWHCRGTPTRIERHHAPPPGRKATWASGQIRDRHVRLPDAIHYAQMLRNKVSAHSVNDLTRSLTVLDVVNVRELLRRIILEGLGFWRRI